MQNYVGVARAAYSCADALCGSNCTRAAARDQPGEEFAAGNFGEVRQIEENRSHTVLAVQPRQDALFRQLVRHEVARDSCKIFPQFLPVAPVAAVAKRAEPLVGMSLADDSSCSHDLAAFAPAVARGTNLIQPTKGRGNSSDWGKARWLAASRVPSRSKTTQWLPVRSSSPSVCFSFESVTRERLSRSSRKSVRRASTGSWVNAAKKHPLTDLAQYPVLAQMAAISTTSPNQDGGEGTDTEDVWLRTAESAILVIGTSLRKGV